MKITAILMLSTCLTASAGGFAQEVTISIKNAKLEDIFKEIKKQTDYVFFYDTRVLKDAKRVSIEVRNASVKEILEICLEGQFLDFSILKKTITIFPKVGYISKLSLMQTNLTTSASTVLPPLSASIINGIVKDVKGRPLAGVSVVVKETSNGTSTASDGSFSIDANVGNVLEFTMVGYQKKSISVGQSKSLIIVMEIEATLVNEVVVVGYGTQKKGLVTAAVSTLDGDVIKQNPVASINNSIAGRVSGVLAFQESGEPGADAANIRVRGIGTIGSNSQVLTVVDGIPRNFSELNPNEIESITVLKDAAAIAPYGLAGANGVVLVTTKRGKQGKILLSYNGWYGVQQPTRYPDYLNAHDFASTLNIARKNAGLNPQYTDEDLQKYKDHSDLDHFPDHDWIKEVIDFSAPMTSHNLNFSGGTEKVRFFSSLGYLYQQGSVEAISFSKYNLAANVDVNATKTTLVSLDIKGSIWQTKNPGSISGTGIYTQVTKQPPLFSQQLSFTNGFPGHSLLPSIYKSGYNNENENVFYSQFTIGQKIPFIPGLALKGVIAFDKSYLLTKQWQTPYIYYKLNSSNEFDEVKAGVTAPRLEQAFDQRINTTLQGYLTYSNSFGDHDVNLLVVAERRNGDRALFNAERINYQVNLDELDMGSAAKSDMDNGGSSSGSKQVGFVYRAAYNYAEKYLAEFSGRYDGHYYFAPGKRFVFFPAVSIGWRLSKEPFIREKIKWINDLKLRGSYGKSGNLAGGPFQYLSTYGLEAGYIFGGTQVQGAFERNEPNVNITWETAKKIDIGLEGTLLNNRLHFEFDVFKERRSDMLVSPAAVVPLEYGIGLSQVNGGIMENKGFDLSITTHKNFSNDLNLDAGITVSYAKNKLIDIIESASTYDNPNRRRTGRPLDTQFGLRALGLFQSQDEIDKSATQFGKLQPGDIKYEDINGDGKINSDDEVVIGDPSFPQLIYGLTSNLSWKGFNLSMLWQGAGKSNFLLTNEAAIPFFNGAKIFKEQLDYWTPDNRDASYPVIMPSSTSNSTRTSSWWIRNGRYLRLKNLEIGYTIPAKLVQKININGIRLFVAGQNLLTFSSEKYLDPEIGVSSGSRRARYYFQQKVYSFGLNVNF